MVATCADRYTKMDEKTTITVRPETRDKLFRLKESPADTYDKILTDLIEEA